MAVRWWCHTDIQTPSELVVRDVQSPQTDCDQKAHWCTLGRSNLGIALTCGIDLHAAEMMMHFLKVLLTCVAVILLCYRVY